MAAIRRQILCRILLFMTIILQLQRVSDANNESTQAPTGTNQETAAPNVSASSAPASSPAPTTPAPTCTPLTENDHLKISYSNGRQTVFPIGTIAYFSCDSGYDIMNNTNLAYTASKWNGSTPTSSPKKCGTPADVTGATASLDSGQTVVNSTATYTCNSGYKHVDNNGDDVQGGWTIKCEANGQWSASSGTCKVKDCGTPTDVTGATASLDSGQTVVNSTATYTCNSGYKHVDNNGDDVQGGWTIKCEANGQWSASSGTCKVKDCGTPADVTGATASLDSGQTVVNSTATYTCNSGYKHVDNNGDDVQGGWTIQCEARGQWSASSGTCKVKDCGTPTDVTGATASLDSGQTVVNSTATYTCNSGYKHVDNNGDDVQGGWTIKCEARGQWSASSGTCKVKDCGTPTDVTGATASLDSGQTVVNSTATYTCNSGYKHVDNNGDDVQGGWTIKCEARGQWSASSGTCKVKECGTPTDVTGATASLDSGQTVVNSTATYTCNSGYKHVDNNGDDVQGGWTIKCEASGQWSASSGTCKVKDCNSPPNINNGHVTVNTTTVNSTADYSCDPGYNLDGNQTISCQSDGTWENKPSCSIGKNMYNSTCTNGAPDEQCVTKNSTCKLTSSNLYRCLCNDSDYHRTNTDGCFPKIPHNKACDENYSDQQCMTHNAVCQNSDGVKSCVCETAYYFLSSNDSCVERPRIPKHVSFSIREIYSTESAITVKWSGTDNNYGFSINITWTPPSTTNEQFKTIHWDNDNTDTIVDNLQPGTLYTFSLYFTKNNVSTVVVNTISGYTKPLPIDHINFTKFGEKTMSISWPRTKCETYSIYLNGEQKARVNRTGGETQTYDFTGLVGGTKYNVSVVAEVPGWSSDPVSNNHYTRPVPPTDVTFTKVHTDSMTIQPQLQNTTYTDSYNISVYPDREEGTRFIYTPNKTIFIENLQPSTMYTFTIHTVIDHLQSERYKTVSKYTRPLPPASLTSESVFDDSLELQWTVDKSYDMTVNTSYYFDEFILEYKLSDSDESLITLPFDNQTLKHRVMNLTAGTRYVFNLYTSLNGTRSETSASYTDFTKPTDPAQPIFSDRTDRTLTITFPTDENDIYEGYVINETFYARGNGTIILFELQPGEDYTFIIFTGVNCSDVCSDISLSNVTFENFTSPAPPENASFPEEDLHETSLKVTWTAVNTGNVDCYIVQLTDEGNYSSEQNFTHDSNDLTATFDKLTSGVKYTVTILSYWREEKSYRDKSISTYTRPLAPNVSLNHVAMDSFNFSIFDNWPSHKFVVNSSTPEIVNSSEYHVIGELSAGTYYSVEIFSIIGGIVGENNAIIKSFTRPNPVNKESIRVLKDDTTSDTLAIAWDKPAGTVHSYSLQISCTSSNGNSDLNPVYQNLTEVTRSNVTGLDPGTFCSVTITTQVGNQTGDMVHKDIDWSTNEIAPEKVEEVNIGTTARTFNITWAPPVKPNGVVRQYVIEVTDVKNSCTFSRVKYSCTDCKEDMSEQTCDGNTPVENLPEPNPGYCSGKSDTTKNFTTLKSYTHKVDDLHPYRNYTVKITPYTRCYGKENTNTEETEQAAPTGPPVNLTQIYKDTTSDNLAFSWLPPAEDNRNGIITNYSVTIKYKERTCFNVQQGESKIKADAILEHFTVSPDSSVDGLTAFNIQNRFAYWQFEVSVTAWTEAGLGNMPATEKMMTNQSVPDQIRSPPEVTGTSTHSVSLKWEPPCHLNGVIGDYHITIFSNDQDDAKPEQANQRTSSNVTSFEVSGLHPYHNYTFSVAAINTISQEGDPVNISQSARTKTGKPYKPTHIMAKSTSAKVLQVNWTTPTLKTGVTKYRIVATEVSDPSRKVTLDTGYDFSKTSVEVGGLEEYWNYTVTVTAITSAGINTSVQSSLTTTLQAAPGPIQELHLSSQDNVTLPRSIDVNWKEPTKRNKNGILTRYFITYAANINGEIIDETRSVGEDLKHFMINDIKPGSYIVSVFAATSAGNGSLERRNITVPAGAPIRVQESFSAPLMKTSNKTSAVNDTKTQIAIELPLDFLCDDANGKRKRFGIIIAAEGKANNNTYVGSATGFETLVTTTYKSWNIVQNETEPGPYITSHVDWNPCPVNGRRKRRSAESNQFVVGADGNCGAKNSRKYCNGPLKPDTRYRFKAYTCTEGGCSETYYSLPVRTAKVEEPASNNLPVIIGAVAAAVVFVLVVIALVQMKRRQALCFSKAAEEGNTHRRPSIPLEPRVERPTSVRYNTGNSHGKGPESIRLSDFPEHVDDMKKDSLLKFSDIYKLLKEKSPKHPTTVAESQICRPKNRYTNILPFDHSRVKILPLDDEEGSDYINANYIPGYTSRREYIATQGPMPATFDDFWRMVWEQNGYTSRREYIATQGPMPATFDDFWRMVWEQNVEIIVMLTKLMEKGRNKCDKYWPNQGESQFYGDLSVSIISESNLSDYTIRIMEMKLRNEKRKVKQFSFLKWPDMGCPEYPELLLEFVKSVRQHESRGQSSDRDRPMVVHCSAGVGRTGTFIAVDHLLQHIRDHDDIDIYNIVLDMRNNRCHMVQTEDQYVYIHECIREFITNDDDDDDYDDEDDNHLYANSRQENIYENTGFSKQF